MSYFDCPQHFRKTANKFGHKWMETEMLKGQNSPLAMQSPNRNVTFEMVWNNPI